MTNTLPIQPGEEIVRTSSNGTVFYECCTANGDVFNWTGSSVEEAREACAQWLLAK